MPQRKKNATKNGSVCGANRSNGQKDDVKSLKRIKPNSTAEWRKLENYFKSKERPRSHQLLNKLPNLKLESG